MLRKIPDNFSISQMTEKKKIKAFWETSNSNY